jgi:alkylhydroperoxidase/carboxymuconolactone decarboxylase family protein YurZ
VAAALRDRHAVRAQAAGADKLGVEFEDVAEALRVTFLLAGMPAYVYGRTAIEDLMKR